MCRSRYSLLVSIYYCQRKILVILSNSLAELREDILAFSYAVLAPVAISLFLILAVAIYKGILTMAILMLLSGTTALCGKVLPVVIVSGGLYYFLDCSLPSSGCFMRRKLEISEFDAKFLNFLQKNRL